MFIPGIDVGRTKVADITDCLNIPYTLWPCDMWSRPERRVEKSVAVVVFDRCSLDPRTRSNLHSTF